MEMFDFSFLKLRFSSPIWIVVFAGILSEAFGFVFGRPLVYFSIVFFPLLFSLSSHFPRKLSLIFFFLCLNAFLTVIWAANRQEAFEQALFLVGLSFFCIAIWQKKEKFARFFPSVFLWFCSLCSLVFLFKSYIPAKAYSLIDLSSGYQLIFSPFGSHHHIGDLLVVGSVVALWMFIQTKKKLFLGFFVVFVGVIAISFSRSAYLAFALTIPLVVLTLKRKNEVSGKFIFLFLASCLFLGVLSFAIVWGNGITFPQGRAIRYILSRDFGLENKSFFASRPYFFSQALSSVMENPLGIGGDNFSYASLRYYPRPNYVTTSSHNIVFDTFVEQGVIGGFLFLLLVIFALKQSKKTLAFFSLLALFLLMQTDYIHKILLFQVLLFFLIGLVFEEKKTIEIRHIRYLNFFFCFLGFVVFMGNGLFYAGYPKQAITVYPLLKKGHEAVLNQAEKKNVSREKLGIIIERYIPVAPYDASVLFQKALFAYRTGDVKQSYDIAFQAYSLAPLESVERVAFLYRLKREVKGEKDAEKFASLYFHLVLQKSYFVRFSVAQREKLLAFCLSTSYKKCYMYGK